MSSPLVFGIVAGEKSGDILGAALIREMRRRHPEARFIGIGGDEMIANGCESLFPIDRLSVMGFVEPLGRLPELFKIKRVLFDTFTANPPVAFIGIDSPDFNLRLEKQLREAGLKTVHYVSPSVWAYRKKRIFKIKQAVDLMLTLFPFETEIYQRHGIDVCHVGHPLADQIGFEDKQSIQRKSLGIGQSESVVALMPGSRAGEIDRLAPIFFGAAIQALQKDPSLKFLIPYSSVSSKLVIQRKLKEINLLSSDSFLLLDSSHRAMSAANFVVMASGTATLEALLLRRPMVICYKLAALTYAVASRMVKIENVGLPNLLAGKRVVPEYMQSAVTVDALSDEIGAYFSEAQGRLDLLQLFEEIHRELRCDASAKACDAIEKLIATTLA